MRIDADFFAGEHLRWNLGWVSPNYAGAFVATALALGFVGAGARCCWRWALFAVELGGFLLLAKTYSRGGLVAWGGAWVFGVLSSRGGLWRSKAWLLWLARPVAFAAVLFGVGFQWSRAAPPSGPRAADAAAAQGDRSVSNRLDLWRGGLKMIAAAPITGWGAGESGRAYQNWFQAVDRDERFVTLVNSPLSVAGEFGLPVLASALLALGVPLMGAWRLARAGDSRARAAGAALVAWSVANLFSTLWIEWLLWGLPGAAWAFLIGRLLWRRALWGAEICRVGVLSVAATTALYLGGLYVGRGSALQIAPLSGAAVSLAKGRVAGGGDGAWHIWPDVAVLGEFPGKALRRCFETTATKWRVVVVHAGEREGAGGTVPQSARGIILFGKQAARMEEVLAEGDCALWVIHPTVEPGERAAERLRAGVRAGRVGVLGVVLPEIDEVGNRRAWERWAQENGAELRFSRGSGVDLRAVWPEVMAAVEEGEPLADREPRL